MSTPARDLPPQAEPQGAVPVSSTAASPPTNVRHVVLLATTATSFILYLDRVCMASIVASPSFNKDLGLSQQQIGWVLSAFFLAYALVQVPAGYLSDRFGARGMMAIYVMLWSVFTAATGLAAGLVTLLVARLGCGLAQAGAYPTSGGLLSRWIPFAQRGRASAIVAFGGRVGGAAAPYLTVLLLQAADSISLASPWRWVLGVYGLAGLAVAALFWHIFREWPEQHPRCNEAERMLIRSAALHPVLADRRPARRVPWLPLIRSASMWYMCLAQWGTNIGWAFLVTWLPNYLTQVKGVTKQQEGLMTLTVLFVGMSGMLFGGLATDVATRRFGLRWGRSGPLVVSRLAAAAAYVLCLWLDSPWAITAALTLVAFSTDVGAGATWAFSQDVGGRHVGSILGWGNMWGNLGASAIAAVIPWVLRFDKNHDWHEVFLLCAAGFVVSAVAALGIDATRPIVSRSDH